MTCNIHTTLLRTCVLHLYFCITFKTNSKNRVKNTGGLPAFHIWLLLFLSMNYAILQKSVLTTSPCFKILYVTLRNVLITTTFYCMVRKPSAGLPWWRSGWESACQCSGHGFEPWSGKIPHAAEQLGPWATTTEPARLEPVLHNKRGRDSERPAHRDEEWPLLAATRKPSHRNEDPTQSKINK